MSSDDLKKVVKVVISPTLANATDVGLLVAEKVTGATNTRKFEAELRRLEAEDAEAQAARLVAQVHEVHRQLVGESPKWQSEPEGERPTPADVASIMQRIGRMYSSAGNPNKRRLISQAFFSAFDIEQYKKGMTRHYLDILEDIEYPEAHFLSQKPIGFRRAHDPGKIARQQAAVSNAENGQKRAVRFGASIGIAHARQELQQARSALQGTIRESEFARYFIVKLLDMEYDYAERLTSLNLLYKSPAVTATTAQYAVLPLAESFMEFVWEDEEASDDAPST